MNKYTLVSYNIVYTCLKLTLKCIRKTINKEKEKIVSKRKLKIKWKKPKKMGFETNKNYPEAYIHIMHIA